MLSVVIQTIVLAPLFLFPMISSVFIYFKLFRLTNKTYLKVLLLFASFLGSLIVFWLLLLFASFLFPSFGAKFESLFGELLSYIMTMFVDVRIFLSLAILLPLLAGIAAVTKKKLFSRNLGIAVIVLVVIQLMFIWLLASFPGSSD